MTSRTKAAVGLSLWVAFLTVAYLFLHGLSDRLPFPLPGDVSQWMLDNSDSILILTVARGMLMAIVLYLAFALMITILAELTHLHWLEGLSKVAGVSTQRMVRNALGVSLVVAVATPAMSAAAAVPVDHDAPVLHHVAPGELIEVPTPAAPAIEASVFVAEAPPLVVQIPAPETWTAIRGDNLWMIARRTLINRGQNHSNADVAAYLQVLVDANREQFTDGSPDLIFPGQVFNLPNQ